MKNYFKLFVAVFAFTLLTNCEKEVVAIENQEVSDFKLTESTFDEIKHETPFIELKEKTKVERFFNTTNTKSSGGSKKIKVVKESVNKITAEDYVSYTFLIENEKNSSSFFENLVMEKRNDTVNAYIITFEPSEEYLQSDNLPFSGSMKIRATSYDESILKKAVQCMWVTNITYNDCTVHGTDGVYHPKCDNYGENAFTMSSKYICFAGASVDFNSDNNIYGNAPSNGAGGTRNSPVFPCDDPRFGCTRAARGIAEELKLNTAQTDWLIERGEVYIDKISKFYKDHGASSETAEEIKLTIEVESEKNKFDYSKKGNVRGRPSLKYKAKAKISGGTSYLLETGEQIFESPSVRKINKSSALFQTSEDDAPYYYMYYPGTDRWYDLAIDNVATDCLSCDLTYVMTKASLNALQFTGRYIVPFEDIKIIIDGKDFDGQEANRWLAAGFLVTSVVPGSKVLKVVKVIPKGAVAWKVFSKVGDDAIELSCKVVNNVVKFGSRSKLAEVLVTISGQEAHHIVPWAFKENKVIQGAAYGGFHMNSKINGKALQKYTKLTGDGLHGNHPAYNDVSEHLLNKFKSSKPNFTPEQARKFLENSLIPEMNQHIESAMKSGLNLNEYFKQVVKPFYNL